MYGVTYQNLGEKGTKPPEKKLSQSGLPVLRKIQKTTPNHPEMAKLVNEENLDKSGPSKLVQTVM